MRRILPFFEFFTVRVVLDATDHEVGKMAVFVCNDIEKAVWTRKKGFSVIRFTSDPIETGPFAHLRRQ